VSSGKIPYLGPDKAVDFDALGAQFHLYHDDKIAAPGQPQHWRGTVEFSDGTEKEYGFALTSGNNAFASATLRNLVEHDLKKKVLRPQVAPTPIDPETPPMGEPVAVDAEGFTEA
jgi:hypothetical protein